MSDSFDSDGSASASWDSSGGSTTGSDSVTETSTEGYGSRLAGSLVAALIGLILIPVAIGVLYYNEGRAVDAIRALNRGAAATVEVNSTAVDPATNGKLVHLTGMLRPTTPAKDPVFGVTGDGVVRLSRKVEMYQWEQETHTSSHQNVGGSKTTETTYSYERKWSEQPVSSQNFHVPNGHQNPAMQVQSASFDGGDVKIGAYRVDPPVLNKLTNFTSLRPTSPPPSGYQVSGDGFYRGADPGQPAIGDVRVTFTEVPAQTASIAAGQASGTLTAFRDVNGYTIALAEPGMASAAAMFHDEKKSESMLTWILRGAGFVAMLIGFVCVTRPLTMLFAIIPFLESLVGAGAFLVALALAVPITLLTISIAWIVHRPVIGLIMLVAAIGAFIGLRALLPNRRPAIATAAPGAMPPPMQPMAPPPAQPPSGSSFFR